MTFLIQGMTGRAVRDEVNSMIDDLQLKDKASQKSASLSGGQKRKLRYLHCTYLQLIVYSVVVLG